MIQSRIRGKLVVKYVHNFSLKFKKGKKKVRSTEWGVFDLQHRAERFSQ